MNKEENVKTFYVYGFLMRRLHRLKSNVRREENNSCNIRHHGECTGDEMWC